MTAPASSFMDKCPHRGSALDVGEAQIKLMVTMARFIWRMVYISEAVSTGPAGRCRP